MLPEAPLLGEGAAPDGLLPELEPLELPELLESDFGLLAPLELEPPELESDFWLSDFGLPLEPLALDLSPACSGAAASSSGESLPSPFLSSLLKSFSCGVPFASSFEMKPSLFLSSDLNIFSAPPSDFDWLEDPAPAEPEDPPLADPEAPELDEPDDPLLEGEVLGVLGVALVLPELPLDALSLAALSSAAWAARGRAKAAATAAAIMVFTFIMVSSWWDCTESVKPL